MNSAAVIAATLGALAVPTYAVIRWGGVMDDPSVGLTRAAWRNRPTAARIRARWQCIRTGHQTVVLGTGDSLESWGECKRCRYGWYHEPTPEVR